MLSQPRDGFVKLGILSDNDERIIFDCDLEEGHTAAIRFNGRLELVDGLRQLLVQGVIRRSGLEVNERETFGPFPNNLKRRGLHGEGTRRERERAKPIENGFEETSVRSRVECPHLAANRVQRHGRRSPGGLPGAKVGQESSQLGRKGKIVWKYQLEQSQMHVHGPHIDTGRQHRWQTTTQLRFNGFLIGKRHMQAKGKMIGTFIEM